MRLGRSGSSAEILPLARALESSRSQTERLFDDPLARGFLSPATRCLFHLARVPLLGRSLHRIVDLVAPGVRGFITGRTRYIDDALVAALAEGIDQVVVLGAGYDSRAYRVPGIESTSVFELDLPSAQAQKQKRVRRLLEKGSEHVTFVPVDFESQNLAEILPNSGFREGRRSFFICEGVTEHVSATAVDEIFRYVAGAGAEGSALAFTYLARGLLDDIGRFPGTRVHVACSGFSMRNFTSNPEELPAYLSERGLELIEDLAGVEFAERYFRPLRRRLRANEFHRTALARVPRRL